jgi:Fur family transcriptional regulator, ferric uptake regulator
MPMTAQPMSRGTRMRETRNSVEPERRAIERWAERVAAEAGLVDVDRTVAIVGRCADRA